MRTLGSILLGIAFQIAAWTFRTFSYIACCAPPASTDPYAATRATSHPISLIVAGVLLSVWLNSLVLFVMSGATRIDMSHENRERLVRCISFVGRSLSCGSALIAFPLLAVAAWHHQNLPAPLFGLFLFSPTGYGLTETIVRKITAPAQ